VDAPELRSGPLDGRTAETVCRGSADVFASTETRCVNRRTSLARLLGCSYSDRRRTSESDLQDRRGERQLEHRKHLIGTSNAGAIAADVSRIRSAIAVQVSGRSTRSRLPSTAAGPRGVAGRFVAAEACGCLEVFRRSKIATIASARMVGPPRKLPAGDAWIDPANAGGDDEKMGRSGSTLMRCTTTSVRHDPLAGRLVAKRNRGAVT